MSATIGLGGGHLDRLSESEAERLLLGAIDLGATLIDTARSYGSSEEKIGRVVGDRTDVAVSTKVGYGIEGHEDWTPGCIRAGIEEARARLRRDVIDVVFLHSCPLATLESGGVLEELLAARDAGKIGRAGYSGDNTELAWAASEEQLDAVQTTVNLCDTAGMKAVASSPKLIVAKRPLANAVWRFDAEPEANDLKIYWQRWKKVGGVVAVDPVEASIRFVANAPGVDVLLLGTSNLDHLRVAASHISSGPLGQDVQTAIKSLSAGWPQII